MLDRIDEVNDALLPRDASYKEDIRLDRIDPKSLESGLGLDVLVFLEVDAVVDDVHLLRPNVEETLDISSRVSRETAMTASAISIAVFSSQQVKS